MIQNILTRSFPAGAGLLLAACATVPSGMASSDAPAIAPVLDRPDAVDNQTFARPLEARVSHVDLDLDLDFARQTVAGTSMLDIVAKPGVDTVILDDDGLDITAITDAAGRPLAYTVGQRVEGKGAPLTIRMGAAREITVRYSAKDADAMQWLTPEQTEGGEQPFLL